METTKKDQFQTKHVSRGNRKKRQRKVPRERKGVKSEGGGVSTMRAPGGTGVEKKLV